ncbi:MAG: LpxI family protein [Lacipirellulaceae bacterium]
MILQATNGAPLGLVAGWGNLPVVVATRMREAGHRVCCLGIRGHAEASIRDAVDEFRWMGAAQLGGAIRYFQRRGVQRASLAGKFHKVDLYRPWAWVRYIPDATFLRTFTPHFFGRSSDRRDDTILSAFVGAFGLGGVEMVPPTDFAPELLVPEGLVAGKRPSDAARADIEFGWRLAKEMGRLDVGQSVCVKDRAVLAVEAIEGTDLCIARAGQLCSGGGFTVVKVAKPQQDMRWDVPTVGIRTLKTIAAAGGRVLAIEAGRTILLDGDDFRRAAEKLRISVVALPAERAGIRVAA